MIKTRTTGEVIQAPKALEFVALFLLPAKHFVKAEEHMTVRPRGRKRTLSKHVSSFNMYMDQVYQVRAIMEATGTVKDAPVIRDLLDEALSARRRKQAGIYASERATSPGDFRNVAYAPNSVA